MLAAIWKDMPQEEIDLAVLALRKKLQMYFWAGDSYFEILQKIELDTSTKYPFHRLNSILKKISAFYKLCHIVFILFCRNAVTFLIIYIFRPNLEVWCQYICPLEDLEIFVKDFLEFWRIYWDFARGLFFSDYPVHATSCMM